MKTNCYLAAGLLASAVMGADCCAVVLLNDDWADGSRAEQNLPTESAWYASTANSLWAAPGYLTGAGTTSSRMWLTYFAPLGGSATLNVGDTLKATLVFTPTGVTTTPATSRGLRIGLYDFSAPAGPRQTADSFSTSGLGAYVPGYMLNMNFAKTFTINNPIQLLKRTSLADANLMGSTTVYTSLGSGGGNLGDLSFLDGNEYTLDLSVKRTGESSADITATFTGSGLNAAYTATDASGAYWSFDGLAIRVNKSTDAAEYFNFSNARIEVVPEPASLALAAGVGLLGLALIRQRRRA